MKRRNYHRRILMLPTPAPSREPTPIRPTLAAEDATAVAIIWELNEKLAAMNDMLETMNEMLQDTVATLNDTNDDLTAVTAERDALLERIAALEAAQSRVEPSSP